MTYTRHGHSDPKGRTNWYHRLQPTGTEPCPSSLLCVGRKHTQTTLQWSATPPSTCVRACGAGAQAQIRREESSPLSLPARGARAALLRTVPTKASSPLAAVLPTALESDSEADSLEDEEQFKARRCAGRSHLGADVVQRLR
jgi:hypothetical protein